jgi:hypothetical protein
MDLANDPVVRVSASADGRSERGGLCEKVNLRADVQERPGAGVFTVLTRHGRDP